VLHSGASGEGIHGLQVYSTKALPVPSPRAAESPDVMWQRSNRRTNKTGLAAVISRPYASLLCLNTIIR